ncbi:hypothetical protein JRQ81_020156, partial [Phrynocephalus forsythii]
ETRQNKDRLNELKCKWVDVYEKSFGTSKSGEVAILISKRTEFGISKLDKDNQ